MRRHDGDQIRVFNGRDGEWLAGLNIHGSGKKIAVTLSPQSQTRPQQPEPDLWLCAAPIKRQHYDYMVQKAVELGISSLCPMVTQRTQVRETNPERLAAIALEAAEQSERLTLPVIQSEISLPRLTEQWAIDRLPFICAEHGTALPIQQALSSLQAKSYLKAAIFTGPEGGFSDEELTLLGTLPNALCVRLGPRILRADTAALAALACWQAQCGDWGVL
jgi:16S rRNA (uracil1498-N3)-methyltransferase